MGIGNMLILIKCILFIKVGKRVEILCIFTKLFNICTCIINIKCKCYNNLWIYV